LPPKAVVALLSFAIASELSPIGVVEPFECAAANVPPLGVLKRALLGRRITGVVWSDTGIRVVLAGAWCIRVEPTVSQ
jgi:hypothetical protein